MRSAPRSEHLLMSFYMVHTSGEPTHTADERRTDNDFLIYTGQYFFKKSYNSFLNRICVFTDAGEIITGAVVDSLFLEQEKLSPALLAFIYGAGEIIACAVGFYLWGLKDYHLQRSCFSTVEEEKL